MNAKASAATDDRLIFERLPFELGERDSKKNNDVANIKGYVAVSTAPINVDGDANDKKGSQENNSSDKKYQKKGINGIKEIADFLSDTEEYQDEEKELVIMVHGYNTKEEEVKKRYDGIFKKINNEYEKRTEYFDHKKLVFIGYRWPSENFSEDTCKRFLQAIGTFPILPYLVTKLSDSLGKVILSFLAIIIPCFYLILRQDFWSINQSLVYISPESYGVVLLFLLMYLIIIAIVYRLGRELQQILQRRSKQKEIIEMVVILLVILLPILSPIIISLLPIWGSVFTRLHNYPEISLILAGYLRCIHWISVCLIKALKLILFVCLPLILLRLSVYFRDSYRASHFAVPDLVDLIKTLDSSIKFNGNQRIKLSFIAHSMGAFVTTNAIRIVSNVFEETSSQNGKQCPENIGNNFALGRLILVSPDISMEAILPGRSNFLENSLGRFEEAYLFSNQGDVILRVFSTIANYFRFPTESVARGFRLGNLTINETQQLSDDHYNERHINGLIIPHDEEHLLNSLSIVCRGQQMSLYELTNNDNKVDQCYKVAKLFTYFDCTEYKDACQPKGTAEEGILTFSINKKRLGIWDDLCLLLWKPNKTHGGYFDGEFCQKMIYGLACLGFEDFLKFIVPNEQKKCSSQEQFRHFSEQCKDHGIQGVLSPKLDEILNSKSILNVNIINVQYDIIGTNYVILPSDYEL